MLLLLEHQPFSLILNGLVCHIYQNYLAKHKMAQKYLRVALHTNDKKKKKCSLNHNDSDSEEIWKKIVKFLIRFNQFESALEMLCNIDVDIHWKAFFRAKILHSQGKYHESFESLQFLLSSAEEGPFQIEALLLNAKNLYFLFQNFEAEESMLRYIQLKANAISSDNMVFLGLIFMQRKNYSCSQEIFLKIVKKKTKSSISWYLLGICLAKNKKWEMAEEAFLKAKEIDPQFSDTILGLFHVRINSMHKVFLSIFITKTNQTLPVLESFFRSMEGYEIMNLRKLEEISRQLEQKDFNDLAVMCLFRVARDFHKYRLEVINQLVNIFQVEKAILSKLNFRTSS